MKNNRKTLKNILFVLILIILFLIIQSTYSKYVEKEDTKTEFKISGWNILVNGIDITETNNFSEELELTFETNENIAPDVLVPTSKGFFTLTIDSTGTDIPFEYAISLGTSENKIEDFKIVSYTINDAESPTEVKPTDESITGIINPSENRRVLTFNVKWYDIDSNTEGYENLEEKDTADNYEDVANSKSQIGTNIKVPVNLKVTQLKRDNINSNTST